MPKAPKHQPAPQPPTPPISAAAVGQKPHPMESDTGPVIPTHSCIRVRNSHDAHVIMEAVRQDLLPLINRRLTPTQRKELGANGSCFVWEKVGDHPNGLKRWDDSVRWRPGLNINPFEIFEERGELVGVDRKNAKTRPDKNQGRPKGTSYLRPSRRPDVPIKPNGMTRQIYTADVLSATDPTPRRWHLVCYYRKSELDMVPTIDTDRTLSRIRVPQGVFRPVTKNIRSLKNPIPVLTIPGETDERGASGPMPLPLPMPAPMPGPGAARIMPIPPHPSAPPMNLPPGPSTGGPAGYPYLPPPGPHMHGPGAMEMDEDEDEDMDEEVDGDEDDESDDNRGPYGPRSVGAKTSKSAIAHAAAVLPREQLLSYARGESFARGEPPLHSSPPKPPPISTSQYPQAFRVKEK